MFALIKQGLCIGQHLELLWRKHQLTTRTYLTNKFPWANKIKVTTLTGFDGAQNAKCVSWVETLLAELLITGRCSQRDSMAWSDWEPRKVFNVFLPSIDERQVSWRVRPAHTCVGEKWRGSAIKDAAPASLGPFVLRVSNVIHYQ